MAAPFVSPDMTFLLNSKLIFSCLLPPLLGSQENSIAADMMLPKIQSPQSLLKATGSF